MSSYLTQGKDVCTIVSNLFLLIAAAVAIDFKLILWAIVLIFSCISSSLYHLCDSYGQCLFHFHVMHNFDFFFAQWIIWLSALYFIHWPPKTTWLEWVLGLLGGVGIVILLITLPGELYVQAGIAGVGFLTVILYWFIAGIPKYRWDNVLIALSLCGCSIILFSVQNIWPQGYWGVHSLWHTSAALGVTFLFFIKSRPKPIKNGIYQNLLARIHHRMKRINLML